MFLVRGSGDTDATPGGYVEEAGVRVGQLSLPTGGGSLRAIGETFRPNPNTGVAAFTIPLQTSACRGAEPDLHLGYNSGAGNGVFGLGFSLTIPNIARKTEKGFPRYDDTDIFVLSNTDDLVPALVDRDGGWQPDEQIGEGLICRRFRPRTEGPFALIEQRVRQDDGDTHWLVVTADNVTNTYGCSENARVVDPDDPRRVYQWLLEESCDAKGNRTRYEYRASVSVALERIVYGNHVGPAGEPQWHFELTFDYIERPDPFRTFRAGFEIRTEVLCRAIEMYHHLDGRTFPVHKTHFDYDGSPHVAKLVKVTGVGVRDDGDGPRTLELPPLTLRYSTSVPLDNDIAAGFVTLTTSRAGHDETLREPIDELVDVYGDGLPGIVYRDGQSLTYRRALGQGRFGPASLPARVPVEAHTTSGRLALVDLDGDGRLDIVTHPTIGAGYFRGHTDGTWEVFAPFGAHALEAAGPDHQFVDLTGDGLADLVTFPPGQLRLHPSLGVEGFGAPISQMCPADLPVPGSGADDAVIQFADMFGDGGRHIVRVRDGSVDCWPHLGYGRFGAKMTLGNAPRFGGQFAASRAYLTDLDGSGTADLVYAHHNRLEIFRNCSGNAFGEREILSLPTGCRIDTLNQIRFADILGTGAACLVMTSRDPDLGLRHHYFDFSGGTKPHLLTEIDNHMGEVRRLTYASSTVFSLADAANARPWATRLAFPVHVLSSTDVHDEIADTHGVTRYAYHDGYFDPTEREFRGFGFVEQWDAESFAEPTGPGLVAPVCTKMWFHSGGRFGNERDAYYCGDTAAHQLTPSGPEPSGVLAVDDHASVQYDCLRALRGHELRREIYGDDATINPTLAPHPYRVTESNFSVRVVQPRAGQSHAVCFPYQSETIAYHYEREPGDPRVEHDFMLQVDDFGHVTRSCHLVYPRRVRDAAMEQRQPRALAAVTVLAHAVSSSGEARPWRTLGVPVEHQTFELTGMARLLTEAWPRLYLAIDEMQSHLATTLDRQHTRSADARLLGWERHFYWDADRGGALPLGHVSRHELLHHIERLVFTDDQLADVFGTKVTPDLLVAGGYERNADGWWASGLIHFYLNEEQFSQPSGHLDPFGARTTIGYDVDALWPTEAIDGLGTTITAEIDRYTLQPRRITDANGNHHEAHFDEVGRVIARSTYGTDQGRPGGDRALPTTPQRPVDTAAVMEQPEVLLGDATEAFWYNLDGWQAQPPVPPHSIEVRRLTHVCDVPDGEASRLQVAVNYVDGSGRALQRQVSADSGAQWLTSGRVVYDNKGNTVQQFEPFYAASCSYDPSANLTNGGVGRVHHYDPLSRVVRVDSPDGSFSSGRFSPWHEEHADANDNSAISDWSSVVEATDHQDALAKARRHRDTPDVMLLDTLGHVFLSVRQLATEDGDPPVVERLETYHAVDIQGHHRFSVDPRLYDNCGTDVHNVDYRYDMLGRCLRTVSVDAGSMWMLPNALGQPAHIWNSRGFHIATRFDLGQRPVEQIVDGGDHGATVPHVTERIVYGDSVAEAVSRNLVGRVMQHFDQSGVTVIDSYSLDGQRQDETRQLLSSVAELTDWSRDFVALDDQRFTRASSYDAFGRLVTVREPDGTELRYDHHDEGWLRSISVRASADQVASVVATFAYNARGQRTSTRLSNGVTRQFTHDPNSFRLTGVRSTRDRDDVVLQDMTFVSDPVGNITRIRDSTHGGTVRDFTYDSVYRLCAATGRERVAVGGPTSPFSEAYTYDRATNRLSIEHTGRSSWDHQVRVAPACNREMVGVDDGTNIDRRYDPHGNLLELCTSRHLTWDYLDRLATVVHSGQPDDGQDVESYGTDGSGHRVRKRRERFDAAGFLVVAHDTVSLGSYERTVEGTTVSIRDGAHHIAVVENVGESSEVRYYLDDQLGSVTAELDADGQAVGFEEFYPYGASAVADERDDVVAKPKRYRYSGKELGDVSGLYFYGARYYAPWMGRWISPDPAGTIDGTNLYCFVGANPVSFNDPNGMAGEGVLSQMTGVATSLGAYLLPAQESHAAGGGGRVAKFVNEANLVHQARVDIATTHATDASTGVRAVAALAGYIPVVGKPVAAFASMDAAGQVFDQIRAFDHKQLRRTRPEVANGVPGPILLSDRRNALTSTNIRDHAILGILHTNHENHANTASAAIVPHGGLIRRGWNMAAGIFRAVTGRHSDEQIRERLLVAHGRNMQTATNRTAPTSAFRNILRRTNRVSPGPGH